jgi:hypothetical protein
LTCGNSGIYDAKRRHATCGYAEGVDGINADRWPAAIDVRMAAGLPAVEHGRECVVGLVGPWWRDGADASAASHWRGAPRTDPAAKDRLSRGLRRRGGRLPTAAQSRDVLTRDHLTCTEPGRVLGKGGAAARVGSLVCLDTLVQQRNSQIMQLVRSDLDADSGFV